MSRTGNPRTGARRPLRWEIAVVLVVKLVLLCLIWRAFFSDGHRQHIDSGRAGQHLVGVPLPAEGKSTQGSDGR